MHGKLLPVLDSDYFICNFSDRSTAPQYARYEFDKPLRRLVGICAAILPPHACYYQIQIKPKLVTTASKNPRYDLQGEEQEAK
jgi:hypothetical protein